MTKRTLYHGTGVAFDRFDPGVTQDGGLHFGSADQARMRSRGPVRNILEVEVNIQSPVRSKDMGGNWKRRIKQAKARGHDGIVYLNRYEGISIESILNAQQVGLDPDKMTDAVFRKWFPEASDSWVAFFAEQVRILRVIPVQIKEPLEKKQNEQPSTSSA